MQCTLLIPHLFWPRDGAESVSSGLTLSALSKLVARSRGARFPAVTPEAWLCQAFEVEKQQDWPIAPLTLELDGGEAGEHYWLRADPVHLRIDRENLVLVENALLDISEAEADGLTASLNAHFSADGLAFVPRTPKRWYLCAPQPPRLETHSTGEVAGHDIRAYLPAGADAGIWHGVFNEMQMLMHTHPVNEAREARGVPPLNSIWFWGGGTRPKVHGRPFMQVWSNEAVAQALAAASDIAGTAVPESATSWLTVASTRNHADYLIVLDDLATACAYHESEAWRTHLIGLEAHWFAPLLDALSRGALSRLALVAPLASACWRFEITRGDLLKFWRRGKPLSHYA